MRYLRIRPKNAISLVLECLKVRFPWESGPAGSGTCCRPLPCCFCLGPDVWAVSRNGRGWVQEAADPWPEPCEGRAALPWGKVRGPAARLLYGFPPGNPTKVGLAVAARQFGGGAGQVFWSG